MRFLTAIVVLALLPGAMASDMDIQASETALEAGVAEDRGVLLERKRTLEQQGALDGTDAEKQQEYIDTLDALGYYDLVAEQYELKLRERPDDLSLLRAAGEAWMKVGPYGREKAFDAFTEVLAQDDNDKEARVLLAYLLHREGLYDQARDHYETVLDAAPEHVRARLGKAVLLVRDGQIQEASALFDAVGAAGQQYDVETRIMLRKALFVFERRGGWFQDTAPNHAAYSRLLYRGGRITDAVPAAQRAVTLAPDDYATWNFMAAMQLQIGNLQRAEEAYGRSLEANPDQPDIEATRRQLIMELSVREQNPALGPVR